MKLSCSSFEAKEGQSLSLWCIITWRISWEGSSAHSHQPAAPGTRDRHRGITPITAALVNHSLLARATSAPCPALPQLADVIIPAGAGQGGGSSIPREWAVAGSSSQDHPSDSEHDVE